MNSEFYYQNYLSLKNEFEKITTKKNYKDFEELYNAVTEKLINNMIDNEYESNN